MTRDEIVADARSYLGVRWVHEGRTRGGLDCVGLVCAVATDLGLNYDDMKGYNRTPIGTGFLKHLMKHLVVNKTGLLSHGSIAVIRQSRYPCHVGLFSEKNGVKTLIHSYLPRRCVVEEAWIPSQEFGLLMVLDFPGVQN